LRSKIANQKTQQLRAANVQKLRDAAVDEFIADDENKAG
jgi:hypothetical protein